MSIKIDSQESAAQFLREVAVSAVKADENISHGAGWGYVGLINGHAVKLATHYGERHGAAWQAQADQIRSSCKDLAASLKTAAEKLLGPDSKAFQKISSQLDSLAAKSLITRSVALKVVQRIQDAQGNGGALSLEDVKGAQTISQTTTYQHSLPRVRLITEKLAARLEDLMARQKQLTEADAKDLKTLKGIVGKDLSPLVIRLKLASVVQKQFGSLLREESVSDKVKQEIKNALPELMEQSVKLQLKKITEGTVPCLNAQYGIASDYGRNLNVGAPGPIIRNIRLNGVLLDAEKQIEVTEENRALLESHLGPVPKEGEKPLIFIGQSYSIPAFDKTGSKCTCFGSVTHQIRSVLPEGDFKGVMLFLTSQMCGSCGVTGLVSLDETVSIDRGFGSPLAWSLEADSGMFCVWGNIHTDLTVMGDQVQLRSRVPLGPIIGRIGNNSLRTQVDTPMIEVEATMTFPLNENDGLELGQMPKGMTISVDVRDLGITGNEEAQENIGFGG